MHRKDKWGAIASKNTTYVNGTWSRLPYTNGSKNCNYSTTTTSWSIITSSPSIYSQKPYFQKQTLNAYNNELTFTQSKDWRFTRPFITKPNLTLTTNECNPVRDIIANKSRSKYKVMGHIYLTKPATMSLPYHHLEHIGYRKNLRKLQHISWATCYNHHPKTPKPKCYSLPKDL